MELQIVETFACPQVGMVVFVCDDGRAYMAYTLEGARSITSSERLRMWASEMIRESEHSWTQSSGEGVHVAADWLADRGL